MVHRELVLAVADLHCDRLSQHITNLGKDQNSKNGFNQMYISIKSTIINHNIIIWGLYVIMGFYYLSNMSFSGNT